MHQGSKCTQSKLPVAETAKDVQEDNQQRCKDHNDGCPLDIIGNGRTDLMRTDDVILTIQEVIQHCIIFQIRL